MRNEIPKFEPPGAGLPWYQYLILRYYMGPFVAGKASAQANAAAFKAINAKILALIDEIPPTQYTTRVLVPPQPALEDNSRYWSLAMVLEHLLIVNGTIKNMIPELASGKSLELRISMADVKPKGEKSAAQIVAEYRRFVGTCMQDLEAVMASADTAATQDHPWFGPFTALQWHWLLAAHTAVHYKQLKGIRRGLPFESH